MRSLLIGMSLATLGTALGGAAERPCVAVSFSVTHSFYADQFAAGEQAQYESQVREILVTNLNAHVPFLVFQESGDCPYSLALSLDAKQAQSSHSTFQTTGFHVRLNGAPRPVNPYYWLDLQHRASDAITSVATFVEETRITLACSRDQVRCPSYGNLVSNVLLEVPLTQVADTLVDGGEFFWILPFTEPELCAAEGSVFRLWSKVSKGLVPISTKVEASSQGAMPESVSGLAGRIYCKVPKEQKEDFLTARTIELEGIHILRYEPVFGCGLLAADAPAAVEF
jgi:hypothetical protein